jgi:hypothetical protein
MNFPEVVTFTGPDDSVTAKELLKVNEKFDNVEWGILFGAGSGGGNRFPSAVWLQNELPKLKGQRMTAHLCGRWITDLLIYGDFTWYHVYRDFVHLFKRIQLNFHACEFEPVPYLGDKLLSHSVDHKFILQCDGVNDKWIKEIPFVHPLFDGSHGAGVLPEDGWPAAWAKTYCGYAGGLGPQNIKDQLPKIAKASNGERYWIDMERRVRSKDDSRFETLKVESVLTQIKEMKESHDRSGDKT